MPAVTTVSKGGTGENVGARIWDWLWPSRTPPLRPADAFRARRTQRGHRGRTQRARASYQFQFAVAVSKTRLALLATLAVCVVCLQQGQCEETECTIYIRHPTGGRGSPPGQGRWTQTGPTGGPPAQRPSSAVAHPAPLARENGVTFTVRVRPIRPSDARNPKSQAPNPKQTPMSPMTRPLVSWCLVVDSAPHF